MAGSITFSNLLLSHTPPGPPLPGPSLPYFPCEEKSLFSPQASAQAVASIWNTFPESSELTLQVLHSMSFLRAAIPDHPILPSCWQPFPITLFHPISFILRTQLTSEIMFFFRNYLFTDWLHTIASLSQVAVRPSSAVYCCAQHLASCLKGMR